MRNRQAILAGLLAFALVATAVSITLYLGERRRVESAELAYADPRADALAGWARNLEGAAIPLQGVNLSQVTAASLTHRLRLASVQLNDANYLTPRVFDAEPPETGAAARAVGADLSRANLALGQLAAAAEEGNLTAAELQDARRFQVELPRLAGVAAGIRLRLEEARDEGTLRPGTGAVTAEEWEALRSILARLNQEATE